MVRRRLSNEKNHEVGMVADWLRKALGGKGHGDYKWQDIAKKVVEGGGFACWVVLVRADSNHS